VRGRGSLSRFGEVWWHDPLDPRACSHCGCVFYLEFVAGDENAGIRLPLPNQRPAEPIRECPCTAVTIGEGAIDLVPVQQRCRRIRRGADAARHVAPRRGLQRSGLRRRRSLRKRRPVALAARHPWRPDVRRMARRRRDDWERSMTDFKLDMTMMLVIHDALRRDLEQVAQMKTRSEG